MKVPPTTRTQTCRARTARAFSLIELLTVIAIIAVVLGILVPTLNSARTTAKKTATKVLMADIGAAVGQFQLDQRKLPGYFPQSDLGQPDNATTFGFTSMENLMLDLAGGIVSSGTAGAIQVGPLAGKQVWVEVTRIGSQTQSETGVVNKGYFRPDGKNFVAQNKAKQRLVGSSAEMPVVVDTFGQPILAWVQDEGAPSNAEFAQYDSGVNGKSRAKFYWASNAGFLAAQSLGKFGENQQTDSLIGKLVPVDTAKVSKSLNGLLGNPATPDPTTVAPDPDNANFSIGKPLAPRAPVVFHSAGRTGEYLSKESRGGKTAVKDGVLVYRPNYDFLSSGAFDDILVTAGN